MEYIPGGSLLQYLNRPTDVTHLLRQPPTGIYPRSLVQVLGIAEQLLEALQHIHDRHVVNLDIKPGNILIRRQSLGFWRSSVPQIVLVDFGISRDLRYPRAGVSGYATVEYMSPEQATSHSTNPVPIDIRSDIFSLGVTLYELLTGQLPFGNLGETLDMDFSPPPPRSIRPSVPPELEALIMRALAKDPRYRFSSAAEMRAAISRVQKPVDWSMTLRRAFSIAALASGIYLGFVAPPHIPLPPWKTPTPVVSTAMPTRSNTPTPIPSPTCTPTVKSESPTPTTRLTSTPRPTSTPTPRPPTATPTATPTMTPRR
ncbi:MAG: Serine/threonine-protein kinase PknB [Chloroflexi bacterium ADurb.Bin360]|nr:MAG: Serine/threonine-protein kinase PknB [Chloroflexi bacterium ADurb.Bin360]